MNDQTSKEIATIEKEITPFVTKAGKIVITNKKEQDAAATLLTQLRGYAKKLKTRKEEITKPMNAALKSARDFFRGPEDKVLDAIEQIGSAMGAYDLLEQKRVRDEEDRIAARVGEGKGHLKQETAVRKMDEIDRPAAALVNESGSVKFRTDKRLKITSETALLGAIFAGKHQELITINEPVLLTALKAGLVIAGAEIEEVRTPITTLAR